MTGQIDDYKVLEVIGTGSFGTCYKVQNKLSGRIYVWKSIDYGSMSEEKKQLLVSEVNLLSQLDHPHIVKYYDRILHRETTTIYIIMEWCQGGDLASLIQRHISKGECVVEPFIWRVLYQTGRALQACHSRLGDVTVLHRDIKPANVFLDEKGNVKLGDFGLARILHGYNTCADSIVGTPFYMSPEVIKGKKYNRKSDIWALGCLVYELCALSPPFVGTDIQQLSSNIKDGRFDPIPSNYSADLERVIELMLSVDHQCRPTVEMILHHPTVLLHISNKESFWFGSNQERAKSENNRSVSERNRIKAECDKATLKLVSEKIRSLSTLDKAPEEVSEDKFQEKWMTRLEALRQRESNIRKREDKLIEKERELLRKEKHLVLIERLSKEKLARAEVYLRQCKENRPAQAPGVTKIQKYKLVEELDTSFSADPGDTSILPTSAKIDPNIVPLPNNFVRSKSERRFKHVHFDESKRVQTLPNLLEPSKTVLGEVQNIYQSKAMRPLSTEIREIDPSKLGAVPKKIVAMVENEHDLVKPNLNLNTQWEEERKIWLENKRAVYQTSILNKQCADQKLSLREKEVKKRSSKSSIFSKKKSIR